MFQGDFKNWSVFGRDFIRLQPVAVWLKLISGMFWFYKSFVFFINKILQALKIALLPHKNLTGFLLAQENYKAELTFFFSLKNIVVNLDYSWQIIFFYYSSINLFCVIGSSTLLNIYCHLSLFLLNLLLSLLFFKIWKFNSLYHNTEVALINPTKIVLKETFKLDLIFSFKLIWNINRIINSYKYKHFHINVKLCFLFLQPFHEILTF